MHFPRETGGRGRSRGTGDGALGGRPPHAGRHHFVAGVQADTLPRLRAGDIAGVLAGDIGGVLNHSLELEQSCARMTRANREAHCGRRHSPGNAAPTTSSTANGSSTAYREFFAICGLACAAGRGGEGAHRHDQAPGAPARNREIRCRRSDLDREIRRRRFSRTSRRRRTHIGLGDSR